MAWIDLWPTLCALLPNQREVDERQVCFASCGDDGEEVGGVNDIIILSYCLFHIDSVDWYPIWLGGRKILQGMTTIIIIAMHVEYFRANCLTEYLP